MVAHVVVHESFFADHRRHRRGRFPLMDSTAISLCMDNRLPIIVFNLRAGNVVRVLSGEEVGTLVHAGNE